MCRHAQRSAVDRSARGAPSLVGEPHEDTVDQNQPPAAMSGSPRNRAAPMSMRPPGVLSNHAGTITSVIVGRTNAIAARTYSTPPVNTRFAQTPVHLAGTRSCEPLHSSVERRRMTARTTATPASRLAQISIEVREGTARIADGIGGSQVETRAYPRGRRDELRNGSPRPCNGSSPSSAPIRLRLHHRPVGHRPRCRRVCQPSRRSSMASRRWRICSRTVVVALDGGRLRCVSRTLKEL